MENTNPTPSPLVSALPLSHQDHPVWSFLGHLAVALARIAATSAPVVAPAFGNPATRQEILAGAAIVQAIAAELPRQ